MVQGLPILKDYNMNLIFEQEYNIIENQSIMLYIRFYKLLG